MKKVIALFVFLSVLIFSCGCSKIDKIDSSRIITACAAEDAGAQIKYTFLASGYTVERSDEAKAEQIDNSYSFTTSNFAQAVSLFEDSCGSVDLTHLSIFLGDTAYISEDYANDAPYIRQKMKISPLIKIFVTAAPQKKLFESIITNYTKGAQDYIDRAFDGKKKSMLCTMSELYFATENPAFTASIPVMDLSEENSLPCIEAALLYNTNSGTAALIGEDFKDYSSCINGLGKTSEKLGLTVSLNGLEVELDADVEQRQRIKDFAQRYRDMGFDVLNAFFFAKKCFPTYASYLDFADVFSVNNIKFV